MASNAKKVPKNSPRGPGSVPGAETPDRGGDLFPIVGIGASAGGLTAFETFFSAMPVDKDPDMAFVLVQHLAPDHKSILSELVQRYTKMRVFEVEDGMRVQENCAYIIPPNRDMSFQDGALHLKERENSLGLRLPIDFFFRSLASDLHERAICIVLSGTGSDGTLGVRAVKGEGGMVMAQSPASTEYNGMPLNAIATGLVDYVLDPAEMPAQLIAYAKFGLVPADEVSETGKLEGTVRKICMLIRTLTGHDFALYKQTTIRRRIERRMAVSQIPQMSDYATFLGKNPGEVHALFRDLLIGVTSFFRDPEAFEKLEHDVLPVLFKGKSQYDTVRVWVPGCSTGEEAYSIAILLHEKMEELKTSFDVQVFATDMDLHSIAIARAGIYPASVRSDIGPDRISRYFSFDADTEHYQIRKVIRDMMVFSEQDIIRDPPFSRLDLISCRNVLIYLGADVQKRLIPLFHYSLLPRAWLFLGSSESIGDFADLFEMLDRKSKLYRSKERTRESLRASIGTFLPPLTGRNRHRASPGPQAGERRSSYRELAEQAILSQYNPVGALVNEHGDILYYYGRTGTYLEPAPGETGANIIAMARDGLRTGLISALHQAATRNETVFSSGLRVLNNSRYSTFNMTVRPAPYKTDTQSNPAAANPGPLFMVLFEDLASAYEEEPGSDSSAHGIDAAENNGPGIAPRVSEAEMQIAALKQELRAKEEYLQSNAAELESFNEELKASNEEMQSVNEELQSTNEELETSKEELQSLNEELSTVNNELQIKVNDLSRLNNDMSNLLAGTGIGTIFVDHKLRVLRFTPTVTKLINLIQSDVGRPIGHIASNFLDYNYLTSDVQSVLDTLIPKDREVKMQDGTCYIIRILPYRTTENVIEGAVISFLDITELRNARDALETEHTQSSAILECIDDGILGIDLAGIQVFANSAAARMLGYKPEDLVGKSSHEILHPVHADGSPFPEESCALHSTIREGATHAGEDQFRRKDGSYFLAEFSRLPTKSQSGLTGSVISFRDISLRRVAEEKINGLLREKELILKEVHHRIKNNMSTIGSLLGLHASVADEPAVTAALGDAENRVQSMMILYDKLYNSSSFDSLSTRDYLPDLVDQIVANFPNAPQVTVTKIIDDFTIDVHKLQSIGIILNELLTNVMKHALAEKPGGLIRITAKLNGSQVSLSIYDNGKGIPADVDIESPRGFGLKLVNLLMKQIDGQLTLKRENGTEVLLTFQNT